MSTKSPTKMPVHSRLGLVLAALAGLLTSSGAAFAADKVTFLTSWFAQAEHGGFYQAKATGLYEKAGLDVTIKMGGPQVNGMQLLLAGEADVMMGYDLQVLEGAEQGLPLVTVGTSFQFDLQGMMAHDDVTDLGDLKGKTILDRDSPAARPAGPGCKAKYEYHRRADPPLHLQPSAVLRRQERGAAGLSDLGAVPGRAEGRAGEVLPVRRRRLSALRHHHGRDPPRWSTEKPDVVARFVKASLRGLEELPRRSRARATP